MVGRNAKAPLSNVWQLHGISVVVLAGLLPHRAINE